MSTFNFCTAFDSSVSFTLSLLFTFAFGALPAFFKVAGGNRELESGRDPDSNGVASVGEVDKELLECSKFFR